MQAPTLTVAYDFRAAADVDIVSEVTSAWSALTEAQRRSPRVVPESEPIQFVHESVRAWSQRVLAAKQAIARGRISKVVLSRQSEARAEKNLSVERTLSALAQSYPTTTRFAVRKMGASFVGATPERLLCKQRRRVCTAALAGTAGSKPEQGRALLSSPKDRDEHAFVVAHLRERLGPYCSDIQTAAAPQLEALPNVTHLTTPLVGQLSRDVPLLRLLEAIHPTPAVCGTPSAAAMEIIGELEMHERGWYGGGVGWIDTEGDGDIWVALRSALIRDNRAWLYAGSGIVADSDPRAEYEETSLKLAPLMGALQTG